MATFYHRLHRLLLDTNSSNHSNNGSRDRYASEANCDANMLIILAALLCALICALGLNSIARCAIRCARRFGLADPGRAASRLAGTGLKKSTLRRIPVVVLGAEMGIPAAECPICLGDFADGEKVKVLPKCQHGFHVRCIDTWLMSNSSCPTYRQSLLEPGPDSRNPQGGAGEPSTANVEEIG